MKIYVGSLQYSPVFKSHCFALGNQCEKKGFEVRYLFSRAYDWMLTDSEREKCSFIGNSSDLKSIALDVVNPTIPTSLHRLISEDRPDFVYMLNIHPFLNRTAAKVTDRSGGVFIQHVHEPYVENKGAYGGLRKYWLSMFEVLQEYILRKVDVVVVSSQEASRLFSKRYPGFGGKRCLIPLMLEDLGFDSQSEVSQRRFVTFIGPPSKEKGAETFLEILDKSEKEGLGIDYLLITRSAIADERFFKRKNLQVLSKERICDAELANALKRSVAVLTPYRTARQSSVVLTAYMCGTPVISTAVGGLKESVHHLKTGYLLDNDASVEEWINGIQLVQEGIQSYSSNCRAYFVNSFSEINWPKYFHLLFGVDYG